MGKILTSISGLPISAASAGFAPTNSADVSAIASGYQVVSSTSTELYAGTAFLTGVNGAPVSASRAGQAANASMANSAYYDGTGRLISSLPDSAAVSAIASAYAESAASGKQNSGDYISAKGLTQTITNAAGTSGIAFGTYGSGSQSSTEKPGLFITGEFGTAYYKDNELNLNRNNMKIAFNIGGAGPQISAMSTGTVPSRMFLFCSGGNSATYTNEGLSAVDSATSTLWKYGTDEYTSLTSVHDTVSANSATWGQGGVDSATVSAIASSYAESAASGKQDALTFAYDDDKISSINGSALAGGGGVTGDYVETSALVVSIGSENTASENSITQGSANSAIAIGCSFGSHSKASNRGFAQGIYNIAFNNSIAQGQYNSASACSFAQGTRNTASATSFARGHGISSVNKNTVFGTYNLRGDGDTATGNSAAFAIGDGTASGARHDLMLVTKDGEITMYSGTSDTVGTGIMSSLRAISAAATGGVDSATVSAIASSYAESAASSKLDSSASSSFYTTANESSFIDSAYLDSALTDFGTVVSNSFYSTSNPSAFVTSGDLDSALNDFATIVNNNFYPTSNPSGFITGVDLSNYATTGYVDSSVSGKLDSSASSSFYPLDNPSGFITGVDLSNYATTAYVDSSVSSKLDSSASSSFYTTANESGFVDSAYVDSAVSGKADSSALSSYALSSDVSGVIDTVSSNSASWGGGGATGDYVEKSSTEVAIGDSNSASGTSFAQGVSNRASSYSFAQGNANKASTYSFAQGFNNSAGWLSVALGSDNTAYSYSLAFGDGLKAKNRNVAFGCFNLRGDGDTSTGESAAFVIGDGKSNGARHDLMLVTKDGEITMYSSTADTVGTGIMSSLRAISAAATGGGGVDSATVSAIASSYAESAVSSKLDESATADFYSTSNPSSFVDSAYVDSAVSGKMDSSAMTSYALSSDVSGTVDLVATQSANWGGSALALSAGTGISLKMVGNTLVASTDETLLWENSTGKLLSQGITLNESRLNFEMLRLYMGAQVDKSVISYDMPMYGQNRTQSFAIQPSMPFMDSAGTGFAINWEIALSATETSMSSVQALYWGKTNFGAANTASGSWTQGANNAGVPVVYKVIGINRTAGF